MSKETTKALITGGMRTLVEAVPFVGGPIAQAWSEYESFKQNERITELFEALKRRLQELEKDIGLHAEHLKHLEDVPFMIEMAVESVRHEQSERKRALYPVLFVNLLLDRPQTSRDERIAMLEALDTLTDADLEVLVQFTRAGWSTGDILSQTFHAGFSSMRDDQVLNDKYEEQLGPFITSTAKLEGRGLIIPTIRIAEFHSTGKEGAWYNQFRRKAWKLLPLGRKLLIAALS